MRHDDLSIGDEAADTIEQQQKRIEELERSLKSEERLSFRHQLEESQAREALQQKRIDDLNSLCAFNERTMDEMLVRLAAAQAQLVKMRDCVQHIVDEVPMTSSQYELCRQALALPSDTTALREMLKQEQERCAKVVEAQRNVTYLSSKNPTLSIDTANIMANKCAAAIRSMEDK